MILVQLDTEGQVFSRSYSLLYRELSKSLGKNGRSQRVGFCNKCREKRTTHNGL